MAVNGALRKEEGTRKRLESMVILVTKRRATTSILALAIHAAYSQQQTLPLQTVKAMLFRGDRHDSKKNSSCNVLPCLPWHFSGLPSASGRQWGR
jgi:hypothetical protein